MTESRDQTADLVGTTTNPDQDNRLWSHALHVDGELVQRGNLYLVSQSMLVGAYAVLAFAGPEIDARLTLLPSATLIVSAAGVLLAILWMYVNHRQWAYITYLRKRCIAALPEYRQTHEEHHGGHIPSGFVISYVVPTVFLAMWVGLAFTQANIAWSGA